MIKKGNERKRDQCDATLSLSQDAQDRISPLIQALRQRIQAKSAKIDKITEQLKGLELEISGLDMAKQTLQGKLNKREEQMHKSELLVKKQKEELRNI
jgi:peptidoglycan hydrolase CwlO-like protein